jgi:hypothetical protein
MPFGEMLPHKWNESAPSVSGCTARDQRRKPLHSTGFSIELIIIDRFIPEMAAWYSASNYIFAKK